MQLHFCRLACFFGVPTPLAKQSADAHAIVGEDGGLAVTFLYGFYAFDVMPMS